MNKKIKSMFLMLPLMVAVFAIIGSSCKREPVEGCTNVFAMNFNMKAEVDDESCEFITEVLEGLWRVVETTDSVNAQNFYSEITTLDIEKVLVKSLRTDPPPHHLDSMVMRVQWDQKLKNGTVDVVETTISGDITDEDSFKISYVHDNGQYAVVVRQTYKRVIIN